LRRRRRARPRGDALPVVFPVTLLSQVVTGPEHLRGLVMHGG
jgi:hypothetical protein